MKKIMSIAIIVVFVCFCGCGGMGGKPAKAGETNIVPGAPTTVKLVIVPNGFKLSWNLSPEDPGIVTGYEIVRSDLATGPFTRVDAVGKGISQYIDTTAAPEIIYYYKLRAMAGGTYSPYSNTVTGER